MPFNQKDYEIGLKNEHNTKPILESYFGCKLNEQDRFNTFDYISQDNSIYIELKCRNNTHSKYPTTMVGMNKVIKGYDLINMEKTVKFCFKFTDGLYYYELKDNNNNGDINIGGRNDRGREEYKPYLYIPINKLVKIV